VDVLNVLRSLIHVCAGVAGSCCLKVLQHRCDRRARLCPTPRHSVNVPIQFSPHSLGPPFESERRLGKWSNWAQEHHLGKQRGSYARKHQTMVKPQIGRFEAHTRLESSLAADALSPNGGLTARGLENPGDLG
jgi:hypothetical protein